MRKLLMALFVLPLLATAQTKQITLEDIYKKGTFRPEPMRADFGLTGIKDDTEPLDFKKLNDENGKPFGEPDDVIYSEKFSNTIIVKKGTEQIYRRSSKAFVYLYNPIEKKLIKLDDEKVMHPSLSPSGNKIAFVKNNNLMVYDIASKALTLKVKNAHLKQGFYITATEDLDDDGNFYYQPDIQKIDPIIIHKVTPSGDVLYKSGFVNAGRLYSLKVDSNKLIIACGVDGTSNVGQATTKATMVIAVEE